MSVFDTRKNYTIGTVKPIKQTTTGTPELQSWTFRFEALPKNLEELQALYPAARFFYASTHARNRYTDTAFLDGDFLVFGKETAGLPKELLAKNADTAIRIPMGESQRSLNLSNSVAIVLYEALRQNNFLDLV